MLNKNQILSATIIGVSALLTSSVFASRVYVGGQVGYGMTHQPGFETKDAPAVTFTQSNHPNGLAGRLFGGYDITNNLAAELGFTKFNNQTATARVTAPTIGTISETVKTYAIDLLGKATLPLQNNLNVNGKLGVAYVGLSGDGSVTVSGSTLNMKIDKEHAVLPAFGAGVSYNINQNISADASWMRYQRIHRTTESLKSQDFFGIGLTYHFS